MIAEVWGKIREVNIEWSKTIETLIPLLIMAAIGATAKVGYDYRKNIFLWFKKQKLRIFPANFNVAFSVDFKEGFNSGIYYEQIKKNLLKLIDDAGLQGYIKLNDFSDIHKSGVCT